ncbi:UDP-N-acetylglucosamine--undecaprenyl-phosphate N-acetylglucosaminephosphotransferase [Psychrosphaera ytuae]|uniref:Undecaprenyl-phosphate alpha-N-acetylglucosaminyl 1-phosphate transferase n=1 Tax=Psychrosphaera ytuae TaxID=2820710 RepID=A0A975HKS9_9GAMM|nr:UDP-N-acetylglucosamine--undecaprenyl-phosphate N-acetylglucosaminephosphotransferase [Psychrosphaera ytuae]QTH64619.1 UDP-N-acetylglucosamine--undecaprenyl-phosphate N-acetylglucosaminephosphotransferase [Psychrosphaera ytuae]
MDYPFVEFLFVFFVAASSLYIFRKIGKAIGLVDKPNARKHHDGAVPLIGGVSICFTVVHYLYFNPVLNGYNNLFIAAIVILTVLGAVDDRFDVSFKFRILVQAIISVVMIHYSGIMLADLGNLFGLGNIELGWLGWPVTVLAVVGAINAFNMVDGIDGLLGGLSIVTFGSVAVLMGWTGQEGKLYISLLFLVAIIPFIFLNLGIIGRERKVFMGDAGSMMIGFTVVWLLLGASQEQSANTIRPVTCLWLIAIPLFDMASIVIRRVRRGHSPFYPDRDHIHHILQRFEFSDMRSLVLICSIAILLAGFGVIGEVYKVPESVMFISFLVTFVVYHLTLKQLCVARPHDLPSEAGSLKSSDQQA